MKQQDERPRKSIIGELTSSNYTLREFRTKSTEEAKRYRTDNRNSKAIVDVSGEGSSTDVREGWICQKGSVSHRSGECSESTSEGDNRRDRDGAGVIGRKATRTQAAE